MQDSTPEQVLGPDLSIKQDKLVPQQPGDVIAYEREEHVHVHSDSSAMERATEEEYEEGKQQEDEGDDETRNHEEVHEVPKALVFIVQAVRIV